MGNFFLWVLVAQAVWEDFSTFWWCFYHLLFLVLLRRGNSCEKALVPPAPKLHISLVSLPIVAPPGWIKAHALVENIYNIYHYISINVFQTKLTQNPEPGLVVSPLEQGPSTMKCKAFAVAKMDPFFPLTYCLCIVPKEPMIFRTFQGNWYHQPASCFTKIFRPVLQDVRCWTLWLLSFGGVAYPGSTRELAGANSQRGFVPCVPLTKW